MTPRIRTVRDETGVALPLALFAIVTLSGLLLTFLSMAGMEPVIAQNHTSSSKAFYIADAGIEHALDALQSPGSPALPQVGKPLNLFPGQVFGSGSYSVTVSQNADGTYLLASTGTYKDGSRVINVRVSLGNPPAPRGAAEILVAGGKYEFGADPGGSFDGRDWNAPANIAACVDIANCGTKISDTGTYGAFANSSSGVVELTGGGAMWGTNCTSGGCGTNEGSASMDIDKAVPLTRWDTFIDQAIAKATRTTTGNDLTKNKPYTWGTPAAPEITVINNSSTVSWNAQVNGAGVLIIDSPGPAGSAQNLVFSKYGQLNWQGLVIIRSPGTFAFEVEAFAGSRVRVFGQVINRAATRAEIELNNGGPNFIKYSTAAMTTVQQSFGPPPSFTVRSWQEKPM